MIQRLFDYIQGKPPIKRNRTWGYVRAVHLRRFPKCALCGGTKRLQVHHIIPVHVRPDFELVDINLMTLCRAKKYGVDCHLAFGHHGNFRKWNINVRESINMMHIHGFKGARKK